MTFLYAIGLFVLFIVVVPCLVYYYVWVGTAAFYKSYLSIKKGVIADLDKGRAVE